MQEMESTNTFFPPWCFPTLKGQTHSTKSLPSLKQGVCTDKCHRDGVIFHRVVLKEKTTSVHFVTFSSLWSQATVGFL